jgi:CBS domain-containing protein
MTGSNSSVAQVLDRKGRDVYTISPQETVFEAIAQMAAKGVGALLVVDEGRCCGLISERDYARRVILKGRNSRETRVEEIMSSPLISVSPDETVESCLRLMTERRIRHLPVVVDGRAAGIVSIGDLVRWIVAQQEETISQLHSYIAGAYPA